MPELPDIETYLAALERIVVGKELEKIRLASPFLLRSVKPPLADLSGKRLVSVGRLGKRIVFGFEGELFLVLHLIIAGRLRWLPAEGKIPKRSGLAALDFPSGSLLLTEAGSTKRASLHLVRGKGSLTAHDPGGLELATADIESFKHVLASRNHTLKRALTDPRLFSGIGNAYSDEILHRAGLSPFKQTSALSAEQTETLFRSTVDVLAEWTARLQVEALRTKDTFPTKVTAFRPEMAVHGKYGKPCPACGAPVQRIVYANNEANYCPGCQTGGKILADRVLSKLLKADWPKTLEELEERGLAS